ncbi:MAG: tetratricopeptide repeat protein [Candidatus Margulisiibacteriota bacterium]
MIKLQGFVSRPKSVRMQLAEDIWALGSSVFFNEKVPFSTRNGPAQAKRIVALIIEVAKLFPKETDFRFLELGAGLGLLSHFVLKSLKEQAPALYEKTTLFVSDIRPELTAFYSQSGFKDEKLVFLTTDATAPEVAGSFHFVFSTYLLDTFPARHVVWENKAFFEGRVKTCLKTDAIFPSFVAGKPVFLDETDVYHQLRQPFDNRKGLSHRIMGCLDEAFEPQSIDAWTQADQQDLRAFWMWYLDKNDLPSSLSFNVSHHIPQHLAKVHELLKPNGAYFCSDFGFATTMLDQPLPYLVSGYGATQFYAVAFPYVQYHAEKLGFSSQITAFEGDQTQDALYHKSKTPVPELVAVFKAQFSENLAKRIGIVLDDIDSKSWTPETVSGIGEILVTLTDEEQLDYYLLRGLASLLYQDGLLAASLEICKQMIAVYGPLAFDAYLLLGWVFQQQPDHRKAVEVLKKALLVNPHSPIAQTSLAISLVHLKHYDKAETAFKTALTHARHDAMYWQTLSGLISAFSVLPKGMRSPYIRGLKAMVKAHRHLVPAEIKLKVKSLI